jgi:hypothetical protein
MFRWKVRLDVNVSHQTVLNYAESAAYHCHQLNMRFKGLIELPELQPISTIQGRWAKILSMSA